MIVQHMARCVVCVAFFATSGLAGAASCLIPAQTLPAQNISTFLADPNQLLTLAPNGGPELVTQVRDLAASDPATLPYIAGLLKTANERQQTSIGAGLGMASRMCVGSDQAYARQIEEAVAGAGSQPAVLAYSSVTLDSPIGSTDGAGGGVGSGGGGPTNGGAPTGGPSGTVAGGGSTFVASAGFNFLTGGTVAAGVLLPGGGGGTGDPVSAH
jgi:hypothetical protein